jgi:uncharacterized Ntn-hydrolase superfamily protein
MFSDLSQAFRQHAKFTGFSAALVIVLLIPAAARATYSIVACDAMTGQCGVAVQTDNLAVGASVPYAQAGVGAIASQFETNPRHGPRGLALLAEGKSGTEVLQQLLREDGNFEGRGIEARQVAVVSADGKAAVHTGTDVAKADWAGSRLGNGFSIQGNGLASPQVIEAMERAFLTTPGSLADRLLAALSAGDQSGGQRTGRESAALLVRTREGFPLDIDLRVDHADDPVGQLRFLYGLQTARQQLIEARNAGRRGNKDEAKALLVSAAARANTWPRACILAAEVAVEIEQPALATQYLILAFARSPQRISIVLGDGTFASLGHDPAFHRWIGSDLEKGTLDDYQRIIASKDPSGDESLALARRLLEIGHATEAQAILKKVPERSPDVFLLNATVFEAHGNQREAFDQCRAGLRVSPGDLRLKYREARLQQTLQVTP